MINLPQSQKTQSRAARPGRSGEIRSLTGPFLQLELKFEEWGHWLPEITQQFGQTTAVIQNIHQSSLAPGFYLYDKTSETHRDPARVMCLGPAAGCRTSGNWSIPSEKSVEEGGMRGAENRVMGTNSSQTPKELRNEGNPSLSRHLVLCPIRHCFPRSHFQTQRLRLRVEPHL